NLPIDTPSGKVVRLADLADVAVKPTPNVVKHEHLMRTIDVGVNVEGRDLGSVANDVQKAIATVPFPLEYRPGLMGENVERQTSTQRVYKIAIISAIGIFLILHASFKNSRLATLAFITLP